MTNYNDYQKEFNKKSKINKLAMAKLTKAQLKAIRETYRTLNDALDNIRDIQDLNLSDIHKLNNCFWSLHHNFNLGGNDDEI